MSVKITDADAIDKIALVEGALWLNDQYRALMYNEYEHYTIYGAKRSWYANHNREGWGYTIYGAGGWNRYFVREDGHIAFSRYHAAYPKEKTIAQAIEAGFDIE